MIPKKEVAQIQIKTVRTDAAEMAYFQFGQGRETLVILPGLSVRSVMHSADAVAEAYRSLTNDFTIYVFDRREELPTGYSVFEMAEDTAAAFRALGLREVCLFGASQGGMIALAMAIRHPSAVKKLVLCSASACVTEAQYRTIEKWVRLAKAGKKEELYLAFGRDLYPRALFEQAREYLVEEAKAVTDADLKRFIILAEGTRGFDVADDFRKISCPVFAIGSEDDRVLGPDAAVQIARLNTRADFAFQLYHGYGHAVYDTAPDFKERIRCFLKDSPAD